MRGLLEISKQFQNSTMNSISNTIQINLIVPMVMSSCFLSILKNKINVNSRIVNISSGTSVSPYYGWSAYCSSKSGFGNVFKSIGKEEVNNKNFKSICIRPGVVDTDMQSEIRNSTIEDFKDLERFIELKNSNKLFSSDFSAKKFLKFIKKTIIYQVRQ